MGFPPTGQSSFYTQGGNNSNAEGVSQTSFYTQIVLPLGALECICDGNGAPITPATFGYLEVPYKCTIVSATLLGDQAGNAVVDVQRTTPLLYNPPNHPTGADSITASAQPSLINTAYFQDNALQGWTTTLNQGDLLGIVVLSASVVQRLTLSLKLKRT